MQGPESLAAINATLVERQAISLGIATYTSHTQPGNNIHLEIMIGGVEREVEVDPAHHEGKGISLEAVETARSHQEEDTVADTTTAADDKIAGWMNRALSTCLQDQPLRNQTDTPTENAQLL